MSDEKKRLRNMLVGRYGKKKGMRIYKILVGYHKRKKKIMKKLEKIDKTVYYLRKSDGYER